MMKAHWPLTHLPCSLLFFSHISFLLPPSSSASPSSLCIPSTLSSSLPFLFLTQDSQIMKPKDRFFIQGPYKVFSTMHVSGSLRIVTNCQSQKEPFLGADYDDDDASSSSGMLPVEDCPLFF